MSILFLVQDVPATPKFNENDFEKLSQRLIELEKKSAKGRLLNSGKKSLGGSMLDGYRCVTILLGECVAQPYKMKVLMEVGEDLLGSAKTMSVNTVSVIGPRLFRTTHQHKS